MCICEIFTFRCNQYAIRLRYVLDGADVQAPCWVSESSLKHKSPNELVWHFEGGESWITMFAVILVYGSDLRRIEPARLRVQDIDANPLHMFVWNGKGALHRIVTLASKLVPALGSQTEQIRLLLEHDLTEKEYASVWLPDAMTRKHLPASKMFCFCENVCRAYCRRWP